MARVRSPSVYVDTNIFSLMHYRGGNIPALSCSLATRDWWDHERPLFNLYTSSFTLQELSKGDFEGQTDALAEAKRLPFLPVSAEAHACARKLLEEHLVPKEKPGDALQLAMAVVQGACR